MPRESTSIKLKKGDRLVNATLYSPINEKNILDYNEKWKPFFEDAIIKLEELGIDPDEVIEDDHWNWGRKKKRFKDKPNSKSFAIEANGITEAMMIINSEGHKSKLTRGKPITYVEILAAAPWNRKILCDAMNMKRKYKLAGDRLLIQAIAESEDIGHDGRIGLVSLPLAEEFYETEGFIRKGRGSENLAYFELTEKIAKNKLNEAIRSNKFHG